MSDLKPCPFCGDKAPKPRSRPLTRETNRYRVACLLCGVSTTEYGTAERAADCWNRRASLDDAYRGGWIPASERLPEDEGRYAIVYQHKGYYRRPFIGDWLPCEQRWMGLPVECTVTHWMPLPPSPGTQREGE